MSTSGFPPSERGERDEVGTLGLDVVSIASMGGEKEGEESLSSGCELLGLLETWPLLGSSASRLLPPASPEGSTSKGAVKIRQPTNHPCSGRTEWPTLIPGSS